MLKQIVKSCLVAAMAVAMAAPAMAVDVSVTGRTRAWLESTAVKDGPSYMQFKADGRLGASVSGKAGDFTVTAFQNFDIDSDAGESYATIRDQKITLENDSFGVTIGRFSPYGVSKGMAYAHGPIYDAFWVGENMLTADRTDHLTVGLKEVGLTAIVGMNNYRSDVELDSPDGSTAVAGDGAIDPYSETVIGVIFAKEISGVDLAVEYVTASTKIDEKDSDYAASTAGLTQKSGGFDGASFNNLALGVGYSISETMGVAFNYESTKTTWGTPNTDDWKTSAMELWFDLGLGDGMGVSIGYGTKEADDGSDNKTKSTMTNATFSKTMGAAIIFASYKATTAKDDDASLDTNASTMGAGVKVAF